MWLEANLGCWLDESYLKTEKRKKTRECIAQLRRERLLLLGNFKESAVLFWYVGRVWSLQLRLEVPRWREERLVPGAACLVAGAQRGRRGCRLLVGFALAPQLRSPCLPVLMSILPTGGFLQSVVSADWYPEKPLKNSERLKKSFCRLTVWEMGHSVGWSHLTAWCPQGRAGWCAAPQRCCGLDTTGIIPHSLHGHSASRHHPTAVGCTTAVGVSPGKTDHGYCCSSSFENLRAQSHHLSLGSPVKRAKLCWRKRAAFGRRFCGVVQCKSSDHRCRVTAG